MSNPQQAPDETGLVSLTDEEAVKAILATTVMSLWKVVDNVPLILVGKMWKGLVDWTRTSMLDPGLSLASPEDLTIPQCLETADEAIAVIRDLQRKWQMP